SGEGRPKTKRTPSFARQRASNAPPFTSAIGHLLWGLAAPLPDLWRLMPSPGSGSAEAIPGVADARFLLTGEAARRGRTIDGSTRRLPGRGALASVAHTAPRAGEQGRGGGPQKARAPRAHRGERRGDGAGAPRPPAGGPGACAARLVPTRPPPPLA